MVEHDVVGSRMERCAFLVHLRDSVHLIGMVNGAATSRRADTPLPADWIWEKIRKEMITAIRH